MVVLEKSTFALLLIIPLNKKLCYVVIVYVCKMLLTISSGGTGPGSILLAAENCLGTWLSLWHRLQQFISVKEILGNRSRHIEHLTGSNDANSLWNSVILAITAGLLKCNS